jgi:hypothetical protein
MRTMAEPAAAKCRPALLVKRMGLLKIAKGARELRGGITPSGNSDRQIIAVRCRRAGGRGAFVQYEQDFTAVLPTLARAISGRFHCFR